MTLWRAVFAMMFGAALVAARGAEPNIEFSGVLTADGITRLALTDKATGSTQWVEAGAEFNGYTLSRYDAKEDALFVTKDGREHRLSLVPSKTAPDVRPTLGAARPTGANTAAASAIRSNLRMLSAAARQFQLERGPVAVSYSDLVGPGKFITELKPVAGEDYNSVNFAPNITAVSVTMGNGERVSLDLPPPAAGVAVASNPQSPPLTRMIAPTAPPPAVPIAPDTLTPTGRTTDSSNYTVQAGDTWQRVSQATGVTEDELKRLNPAVNAGSPPAGQTIRIR